MKHPLCPNCAGPMILMRAIGRAEGDLHVFECRLCRVGVTEAVKQPGSVRP
jgi:hypothetical protein